MHEKILMWLNTFLFVFIILYRDLSMLLELLSSLIPNSYFIYLLYDTVAYLWGYIDFGEGGLLSLAVCIIYLSELYIYKNLSEKSRKWVSRITVYSMITAFLYLLLSFLSMQ